ncbi:MAG: hypothetical protein HYT87_09825 [Nitrospirae bacterium]|nr:hypothetical protein [Nitrospirota bacterium]
MDWQTVEVTAKSFNEAARRISALVGDSIAEDEVRVTYSGCPSCGHRVFAYDILPRPQRLTDIPAEFFLGA